MVLYAFALKLISNPGKTNDTFSMYTTNINCVQVESQSYLFLECSIYWNLFNCAVHMVKTMHAIYNTKNVNANLVGFLIFSLRKQSYIYDGLCVFLCVVVK